MHDIIGDIIDWDEANKAYLAGEGQTGERYNQRLKAAERMVKIEARWQHLPGGFHGERKRIKIHIQAVADTAVVMSKEELCWLAIAAASAWLPQVPAEEASLQPPPHSGHRSGAIREPEVATAPMSGMWDTRIRPAAEKSIGFTAAKRSAGTYDEPQETAHRRRPSGSLLFRDSLYAAWPLPAGHPDVPAVVLSLRNDAGQ